MNYLIFVAAMIAAWFAPTIEYKIQRTVTADWRVDVQPVDGGYVVHTSWIVAGDGR